MTIVDSADESKTQQLDAEVVLVGIGVTGRFDGLFDDSLGLEVDRGHIKVDYHGQPTYETNMPGSTRSRRDRPPWLAHVSGEETVTCVERMAGSTPGVDYNAIPGCTYTNPQIASIGMTEQAKEGIDYETGTFPLSALGKAIRWARPTAS